MSKSFSLKRASWTQRWSRGDIYGTSDRSDRNGKVRPAELFVLSRQVMSQRKRTRRSEQSDNERDASEDERVVDADGAESEDDDAEERARLAKRKAPAILKKQLAM
jgi:hypothetical protein